jgi:hypothetical protein
MRPWFFLVAVAGCVEPPVAEPFDSELLVEAAPLNGLVHRVRWRTPVPATTVVEFGRDGRWERRASEPGLRREHELMVVGMVADSDYQLRVLSEGLAGYRLDHAPIAISTPPLSRDWLTPSLDLHDPALAQPGWTLANVALGVQTPVVVALFDELGQVVWYYDFGDSLGKSDVQASFTAEGHVLMGPAVPEGSTMREVSLFDELVWEAPASTPEGEPYHHVLRPVGDEVLTTWLEPLDGLYACADTLVQLDREHNTTWEWRFADYFTFSDLDPLDQCDSTHVNSVDVDLELDRVCLHAKYLDLVVAVRHSTGEVLWTLGDEGGFLPDPEAEIPLFDDAHGVKCLGEDRVLIFDNGAWGRGWSRYVEYQLDHEQLRSSIVWQYPEQPEDDRFFSHGWGDVDRLDNGNTLCTTGEQSAELGDSEQSLTRIFEVTPEGERVWQISWGQSYASPSAFKADRIPALSEPLVVE